MGENTRRKSEVENESVSQSSETMPEADDIGVLSFPSNVIGHKAEASTVEETRDNPGSGLGSNSRPQLTVIPGGIVPTGDSSSTQEPSDSELSPPNPTGTAPVWANASSGLRLSFEFFDGPMDLLLHLVQQQEVDISRVSMTLIAQRYLDIVSELLAELESESSNFLRYDLDQVSEYLVIAATLTTIKSSALLPNAEADLGLENPENLDANYLEELRERLRIYEFTKRQAKALHDLPQLGIDTFQRIDRKALLPTPDMLQEPDDPSSLGMHIARLMKRIGALGAVFRIKLEPVSIVSSMMKLVDTLGSPLKASDSSSGTGLRTFWGIIAALRKSERKGSLNSVQNRGLLIGNFLAILELMKRGVINAKQTEDGNDIELQLAENEAGVPGREPEQFSSEFDEIPQGVGLEAQNG